MKLEGLDGIQAYLNTSQKRIIERHLLEIVDVAVSQNYIA